MMEHSGTHIDALCHQACDLTMHDGVTADSDRDAGRLLQLGLNEKRRRRCAWAAVSCLMSPAAQGAGRRLLSRYEIPADDLAAHGSRRSSRSDPATCCWPDELRPCCGTTSRRISTRPTSRSRRSVYRPASRGGVCADGADNMAADTARRSAFRRRARRCSRTCASRRQAGIHAWRSPTPVALAKDRCWTLRLRRRFLLKFVGVTGSLDPAVAAWREIENMLLPQAAGLQRSRQRSSIRRIDSPDDPKGVLQPAAYAALLREFIACSPLKRVADPPPTTSRRLTIVRPSAKLATRLRPCGRRPTA